MDDEVICFIKVWVSAIISVSYCYYLSSKMKAGVIRLLSVLPVCALFFVFPLFFSSLIFISIIAFILSGIASLKLILFAFDQGPLFPLAPNLTQFVCFTCFPIKLQQNPNSHQPRNQIPKWVFAFKVLIFSVVLHVYNYSQNLHPILLLLLYSLQIYLEHEIFFALVKVLLSITLSCNLEPHFNEPYLATSLQDFWSRRWNLMVPAILRPAVYAPVRRVCEHLMNSDWAMFLGFLATFIVSGLFHELVYFYITRETPTWEITLFFVLNGVCTATEVVVKTRGLFRPWWPVRPAVSRLLTMGFLAVTGGWLFFPRFIWSGMVERRANETLLFFSLLKNF